MSFGAGRARIIAIAVALAFIAAMTYLLVHAIEGQDFADFVGSGGPVVHTFDLHRHEVLPALLVAGLSGLGGLIAWIVASGRAGDLDEEREARKQAESEQQRLRSELDSAQSELESAKSELGSAQSEKERLRQAASAQRDWIQKLRGEVFEQQRSHGALAGMDDVRALVLRVACLLLEAEKGLLISRRDGDGDGSLDLVASEGFEHDPSDSAIAQRFAKEVLDKDATVRESGAELGSREVPADEEIKNLTAIPIYIEDEFEGVVVCLNSSGYEEHSEDVLIALGDHAGAILQNAELHGQLRSSYLQTISVLTQAIEVRDPYLRGHSEEVSGYVGRVADRLGIEPKRREELIFGSLLHDVGKLGISERILLKPGRLTPEEFAVIQLHPRIGYRLIQEVELLRPIAAAVLHHHERFDGTGYPSRLAGEQIPLEARIICVADSFSAMTSERPYQRRKSLDEACEELERSAGTQFDPKIVRLFIEEIRLRPPQADRAEEDVIEDVEVSALRDGDEPVLGYGSFAITDNLTLLYSHRYLHEVVRSEVERVNLQGGSFGILLIELTNIGALNISDGYAAGDDAIRKMAAHLQSVAVRYGASAARFSGRRLSLLLPGLDEARTQEVATEIREGVDEQLILAFSSAIWTPGDTGEAVIDRARQALLARQAT